MKLKEIMNLVTDNECVILKKNDAIEPLLIAVALAKDIKTECNNEYFEEMKVQQIRTVTKDTLEIILTY